MPIERERAGHRVARALANRIIAAGWPVGDHLGTEAELIAQLGVGRATFREGVSILQRQRLVRTAVGPRGGLIIEAPPETALSNLLRNFFELTDVSFGELMDVHRALIHMAADLAIMRLTPAILNDLRTALRMPAEGRLSRDAQGKLITGFQAAILRTAGNPNLTHLTLALHRLLADFGHQEHYPKLVWRETLARTFESNADMFAALNARDPAIHGIIDERYDYVSEVVAQLERRNPRIWNRRSFLRGAYGSALIDRDRDQRAPLKLSYDLAAEIRRGDLEPGTSLGNEKDIASRFQASRIVVTEALRMLEFLGIVRVSRGRTACVLVIEPDPALVIDAAALYLEYLNGRPADLKALRRALEEAAVLIGIDGFSDAVLSRHARDARMLCAGSPERQLEDANCLYRELVTLSGNRVLAVLLDILAIVHRKHQPDNAGMDSAEIASAAGQLETALADSEGRDVAAALIELMVRVDAFVHSNR